MNATVTKEFNNDTGTWVWCVREDGATAHPNFYQDIHAVLYLADRGFNITHSTKTSITMTRSR